MPEQEDIKSKFSMTIHWLGDEDFLLVDSKGNKETVDDLEVLVSIVGAAFDDLVAKEDRHE